MFQRFFLLWDGIDGGSYIYLLFIDRLSATYASVFLLLRCLQVNEREGHRVFPMGFFFLICYDSQPGPGCDADAFVAVLGQSIDHGIGFAGSVGDEVYGLQPVDGPSYKADITVH